MNILGGYYVVGQAHEGPVILNSPLLAEHHIRHGFTTRLGGASSGSFSSLNFGLKAGDSPANVTKNIQALTCLLDFQEQHWFMVNQVHGREVVIIEGHHAPSMICGLEADALTTACPGRLIGVRTADCVPVLMTNSSGQYVAAIHAGWRGIVAGVLENTIRQMNHHYCLAPEDLFVAIGPAIGPCCFEVGPEVADQFSALPNVVLKTSTMLRPHLNLQQAVLHLLQKSGVPSQSISFPVGLCTHCQPEWFFSYRRDGAITGHQVSVIGVIYR